MNLDNQSSCCNSSYVPEQWTIIVIPGKRGETFLLQIYIKRHLSPYLTLLSPLALSLTTQAQRNYKGTKKSRAYHAWLWLCSCNYPVGLNEHDEVKD